MGGGQSRHNSEKDEERRVRIGEKITELSEKHNIPIGGVDSDVDTDVDTDTNTDTGGSCPPCPQCPACNCTAIKAEGFSVGRIHPLMLVFLLLVGLYLNNKSN